MKIETKYKTGQKVFYLAGIDIRPLKIEVIDIKIRGKNINIFYGQRYFKNDDRYFSYPENEVFKTKKDAKNYLIEKVGKL